MSQETSKKPAAPAPASGKRFSRRKFIGTAVGAAALAGGYSLAFGGQFRAAKADRRVDVLLIGGGIMSATLGVYPVSYTHLTLPTICSV